MASDEPLLEFREVSVDAIVTEAMAELKSAMAGEHDEMMAEKESELLEAIRKQAETETELYRKLAPLLVITKGAEPAELEAAMSTILSAEEIQTIKDTFLFETYQVEVYTCSIPGPKSFVNFLREGKTIFPTITLDSPSEVVKAKWLQWASIVVETFMLALNVIGIKVFINQRQMQNICKSVEKVIQAPAFAKALSAFRSAWAQGSKMGRAKAIFQFLKDSYTAGIFWKVIKAVLSEMTVADYVRTAAVVAAMLVAAFATGGAVLIAKILMALDSAYTLIQKMRNLDALDMVQVERSKSMNNTNEAQ